MRIGHYSRELRADCPDDGLPEVTQRIGRNNVSAPGFKALPVSGHASVKGQSPAEVSRFVARQFTVV